MEACLAIEQDLEKVLNKFRGVGDHTDCVISDAIKQIQDLKNEIGEMDSNTNLSESQINTVRETVRRCREAMQHLAGDHREVHAMVSRVGKCVDRQLVGEYAAAAPRAHAFTTDSNRRLQDLAIAQHLYRQGLNDAADTLVREAGLGGEGEECSGEPFATIQRIAGCLERGDTAPALAWLREHKHLLTHSPLPFTLHRLQMFKICSERGGGAAIEYAREHLAPLAARHERALQQCVCAVAWCRPAAAAPGGSAPLPPAPPALYLPLLDLKAQGVAASEVWVAEACAAVGAAAHSPLGGAVAAGARLLPALLDVRAKMAHPHSHAHAHPHHAHAHHAYTPADDLPLEVELGKEGGGGGYHSVFACPILRQQTSDANPPMRLVCGHVISRDALNKLAQGLKLKCPYCPTEQSPSEARQIYFS